MQLLVTVGHVCLHAWQWQMSMEARSKQLPDLHGGWLVFVSGWDRVNASWRCFTVNCWGLFSGPHTPDRDAAHVRLQLTPGQATERLMFSTVGIRLMSNMYDFFTVTVWSFHSMCSLWDLKTASESFNVIDSLAKFDGGKDLFRPQVFNSLWQMETFNWHFIKLMYVARRKNWRYDKVVICSLWSSQKGSANLCLGLWRETSDCKSSAASPHTSRTHGERQSGPTRWTGTTSLKVWAAEAC